MKKTVRGFTLIELLVTMSILGILFGIGIAEYNKFNRRQILVQAAQELKTNLRFAQDKALVGEKPSGWCDDPDEVLDGHQLLFDTAIHYQIEAVCSNFDENPNVVVKSVDLPGNGNITGPTGASVLFKVLAQGVENAASFTLTFPGVDSETVIVTTTGDIR